MSVFQELVDHHNELFPDSGVNKIRTIINAENFLSTVDNDFSNNIALNSRNYASFMFHPNNDGTYTVEIIQGNNLRIKSNNHLAYGSIKIPFRKVSGTPEKIIKAIKKWQEKRLQTWNDNKDNI